MKVTWEVDDGYVGGSRPHVTMIDDEDLADCKTEQEREGFISDCIQEDFDQIVSWHELDRE